MDFTGMTGYSIRRCNEAIEQGIAKNTQAGTAIVPIPKGIRLYNGGQECDLLQGPCSCGASHGEYERLQILKLALASVG